MPPILGSIHRVARSDSGAARLWTWARKRKKPWSADDAASACDISRRRCRAIVAALRDAGLIEMVDERENPGHRLGETARTWQMTDASRGIESAPVMIVDRDRGVITGVRVA